MRGRVWRCIGVGLGLVLLIFALAAMGLNAKTRSGKSMLADFVSRAASSENMKLDIGAIEGPLSAHPMLRDISLADKDGVWLKIDHVEMDWSRLPLASLRVDIDRIDIGRVDMLRRPIPAPAAAMKPTAPAPARKVSDDVAPDLPVRFRLGAFQLDALALAAPVLGEPATLTLTGSADAGASSRWRQGDVVGAAHRRPWRGESKGGDFPQPQPRFAGAVRPRASGRTYRAIGAIAGCPSDRRLTQWRRAARQFRRQACRPCGRGTRRAGRRDDNARRGGPTSGIRPREPVCSAAAKGARRPVRGRRQTARRRRSRRRRLDDAR